MSIQKMRENSLFESRLKISMGSSKLTARTRVRSFLLRLKS